VERSVEDLDVEVAAVEGVDEEDVDEGSADADGGFVAALDEVVEEQRTEVL
jgi:hypothetical protein